MKPFPLLYFAVSVPLFAGFAHAQSTQIKWKKSLGGSSYDEAHSIQLTKDGGYILAGNSESGDGDVTGNHGSFDYWVVKTDNKGVIQWEKSYGGSAADYAMAVKPTADEGYIVAGTSASKDGDVTSNHGSNDCWIVKIDSIGNIQWQHSYGGSNYDEADDIVQTSDGGYAFAGSTESTNGDVTFNHGFNDEWIVRIDANGNLLWQKALGGSQDDFANSIQQTSDNGFIVAGETDSQDGNVTSYHGSSDYWIIKLDESGNTLWQKTYGGSSADNATSIRSTADGGYIVAGATYSSDGDITFNHGGYDDWIVKLDNSGNIQWQKSYGGSGYDYPFCIQISSYGYIVAGYSSSNDGDVTGHHGSSSYDDFWVLGLSNKGNLAGEISLGGSGEDAGNFIQQTADGGMIVAGLSYSSDFEVTGHHGMSTYDDYWVVRLKSFKMVPYTSPLEARNGEVNQNTPYTAFLYPILNEGTFELTMNHVSTVSSADVIVMNENGQIVLTRTVGFVDGNLREQIHLQDLAPGLYFVRVESEGTNLYNARFICQR